MIQCQSALMWRQRDSSMTLQLIPPLIYRNFLIIILSITAIHSASVLEYPTCGRKINTTETCISSDSELITESSYARTDIECLSRCRESLPRYCTSAYRNSSDGMCYLINDAADNGVDTCTNNADCGQLGKLWLFISKRTNDDCGSDTCRADEVCIESCGPQLLSSPICLADNSDNCELGMQFLNARQYWNTKVADSTDSGTVWSATYPKMRQDTGVRIIQHMDVRGHYQVADYCHHWYITFDSNKCTNPESIEQLDYSETIGDLRMASDIDGTCWGHTAGDILVESVIAPCNGYGSSDGLTGYFSARTTIIMEVIPTPEVTIDDAKSCPSSIAFNYQYYSWNEEKDLTFDASSNNELIKSVMYTKRASDTSLRLKYNALMSVKITNSGLYYCGRWFLAINGTECDPQVDALILHHDPPNHGAYWRHHRRVRTVEGICNNALDAGVYSIEVWVGQCLSHFSQPTNFISGGFNSPSRIHVEEVRTDHKVDAIYGPNWRVYKSMFANIEHWQWYALDSDVDTGDILSVTYYKEYSDTGLRLTASGVHRTIYLCGLWYFKIDGIECSNPGVIEGVSYFNYYSDVHQPMQTSGVCHGVAVGSHAITYAVRQCPGYNPTDTYTGWQSSFHVFVEEIRVDLVMNCGYGAPVNCDND